ncbi:MFS transporter [Granulicella sp. dw_53]|uniref:MFS transporter n=1 Tax=Granulicella sp. dw_53 TaxID=2719792 RepID=UPI001BD56758|nr:MFS transporter [Granulicella sp. dw_53]
MAHRTGSSAYVRPSRSHVEEPERTPVGDGLGIHLDRTPRRKPPVAVKIPWYRELSRYQVLVVVLASLGWMFDCLDQQLFNLARRPAIVDLLKVLPGDPTGAARVAEYSGYATMIFMIGWASGGVFFGVLGDRIGRARTMIFTIFLYAVFTGLSVFSKGVWDFSFYRFLTGLGVGGQFSVGVALVAETVPDRARPYALGWLQALSTVGNMLAAGIGILLSQLQEAGAIASSWRYMFVVGALPALLCIPVFRKLKEPDAWQRAKADRRGRQLGSVRDLFAEPRWRRNAVAGMLLAFAGVVGLWGIGFFSFDLLRSVLDKTDMSAGRKTLWISVTSLLQNIGGFVGVYAFMHLTARTGRRIAFGIAFVLAMCATAFTFWNLRTFTDILWMIPLMGFSQLALFGGYAIYLPELFPTRLRSTGTSFCYNVGRFVAALGPLALGLLTSRVYADKPEPMRYAGVTMCLVFLIGLATLPFAPETKGKPLPEDSLARFAGRRVL